MVDFKKAYCLASSDPYSRMEAERDIIKTVMGISDVIIIKKKSKLKDIVPAESLLIFLADRNCGEYEEFLLDNALKFKSIIVLNYRGLPAWVYVSGESLKCSMVVSLYEDSPDTIGELKVCLKEVRNGRVYYSRDAKRDRDEMLCNLQRILYQYTGDEIKELILMSRKLPKSILSRLSTKDSDFRNNLKRKIMENEGFETKDEVNEWLPSSYIIDILRDLENFRSANLLFSNQTTT